jgi:ATPase subunit of ABC transporter with duplicated ATPase domains
METMNDMLLIIDEPTNYLKVIYDIYSKKMT